MSKLERELALSAAYNERSKMNQAIEIRREQELARDTDVSQDIGISVEHLISRVDKVREVARRVMVPGQHYGTIPGAGDRKCLFKPGAELLMLTFRLDPQFSVADRWDGEHLESVVTCTLFAANGARLGSGIGSCSTRESKYAWRNGERKCPHCSASAIIKGKKEYGGGWICFKNKGGCGAKFGDKDTVITSQQTGRVPNPDIADCYNTVRKMACKRALVAGSLLVTGASELFTQDLEDDEEPDPAPRNPTPRRTPDITPHGDDSDLSEQERASLIDPEELMAILVEAQTLLAAGHWEKARSRIGMKGGDQGLFGPKFSAAKLGGKLSADYSKTLGKLWGQLDRQIAKLEKAELEKPVDVLSTMTDPPDPEDFPR